MQCTNCGTAISDGVTACPNCGARYQKRIIPALPLINFAGICCFMIGALPILNREPSPRIYIAGFSVPSIALWIAGGAALLILYQALVRNSSFEWVGGRRVENGPLFLHFDYDFCRKVARLSAVACVVILAATITILLSFGPSFGKCVDWSVVHGDGEGTTNIWFLVVLFCMVPAAFVAFHALRWDYTYRKIVDRAMSPEKDPYKSAVANVFKLNINVRDLDYNHMFVVVAVGWALFCAAPIFIIFFNCRQGL